MSISLWKLKLIIGVAKDIEPVFIQRNKKVFIKDAQVAQESMERLSFVHGTDVMSTGIKAFTKTFKAMHVSAGLSMLLEKSD
jgi:hypothetical protein